MASHHIAIQVIHLSFLPALAVAEAGSVLAGQAVGAGAYHLVKRVAHLAMGITAVYAGAWSILLAFGAPLIVSGFTTDAAVVSVGTSLLHVAAVFQIFDASNIVDIIDYGVVQTQQGPRATCSQRPLCFPRAIRCAARARDGPVARTGQR